MLLGAQPLRARHAHHDRLGGQGQAEALAQAEKAAASQEPPGWGTAEQEADGQEGPAGEALEPQEVGQPGSGRAGSETRAPGVTTVCCMALAITTQQITRQTRRSPRLMSRIDGLTAGIRPPDKIRYGTCHTQA